MRFGGRAGGRTAPYLPALPAAALHRGPMASPAPAAPPCRCSDAPLVERAAAAYRVMKWRNRGDPVVRKDAFDYVFALKVGGPSVWLPGAGCRWLRALAAPACADRHALTGRDPAECVAREQQRPHCMHPWPSWQHSTAPTPPRLAEHTHASPLPLLQVIFGAAHDPQHWDAHAPEAMDGQFINEQVRAQVYCCVRCALLHADFALDSLGGGSSCLGRVGMALWSC